LEKDVHQTVFKAFGVRIKKMRVCLINPPRIHPKLWGKPSVFQPTDLAYVAAVLEKQHKMLVIDACAEGWRNLELEGMR